MPVITRDGAYRNFILLYPNPPESSEATCAARTWECMLAKTIVGEEVIVGAHACINRANTPCSLPSCTVSIHSGMNRSLLIPPFIWKLLSPKIRCSCTEAVSKETSQSQIQGGITLSFPGYELCRSTMRSTIISRHPTLGGSQDTFVNMVSALALHMTSGVPPGSHRAQAKTSIFGRPSLTTIPRIGRPHNGADHPRRLDINRTLEQQGKSLPHFFVVHHIPFLRFPGSTPRFPQAPQALVQGIRRPPFEGHLAWPFITRSILSVHASTKSCAHNGDPARFMYIPHNAALGTDYGADLSGGRHGGFLFKKGPRSLDSKSI